MVADGDKAGRPGFRPSHPGRILRRSLKALGMTQEEFAEHIDVSRQTISAIIGERSGVTAEIAVKLGRAFDTSPQFWAAMQINHDIWNAEQSPQAGMVTKVKVGRSAKSGTLAKAQAVAKAVSKVQHQAARLVAKKA